jgi:hypothetical protein
MLVWAHYLAGPLTIATPSTHPRTPEQYWHIGSKLSGLESYMRTRLQAPLEPPMRT